MTQSKFRTGEWKLAIERCKPDAAKVMKNFIEREIIRQQKALVKIHYPEADECIVEQWRKVWAEIKAGPHGKRLGSLTTGKNRRRASAVDSIIDPSK